VADFSLASYIHLPLKENTGGTAEVAMTYRAIAENPGRGSVQGKLLVDTGSGGGSNPGLSGATGKPASITLETSVDGETWTAVGAALSAVSGGEATFSVQVDRFFRVKTAAGSGYAFLQMHTSAQYNEMRPM